MRKCDDFLEKSRMFIGKLRLASGEDSGLEVTIPVSLVETMKLKAGDYCDIALAKIIETKEE